MMSDPIVSTTELARVYGEGRDGRAALRGVTTTFPTGQYARSWARPAPASRRSCTCSPGSTGRRRARWSSTGTSSHARRPSSRLRRDRVGFVFQAFNLVPALTAEENIVLPLTLAGPDRGQASGSTQLIARRRPGGPAHPPALRAVRRPAAARAVARALITGPPWSSPTSRPATWTRRRRRGAGAPAPPSTSSARPSYGHPRRAASVADRIVVLSDGGVVHDGAGETPRASST